MRLEIHGSRNKIYMKKINKMVFISLIVAQSLIMFIIENQIPYPFIAPGAKIGLSNLFVVISLYIFDGHTALVVVILKVILSSIITGNMSSFLYSMSGGLLSLFFMSIEKKYLKDIVSILGVSITGAVMHNFAQIVVASLITGSFTLFLYLPVLTPLAILSGLFIGLVSKFFIKQYKRIRFF